MFTVVLDACVLVPAALADSVLRISEAGAFAVRWSAIILDEVERTMTRLGIPPDKAAQRIGTMTEAFPFAAIEGYQPLVDAMRNDRKDRHVLAAAVSSECHTIVTFNLADFPSEAVDPWVWRSFTPTSSSSDSSTWPRAQSCRRSTSSPRPISIHH